MMGMGEPLYNYDNVAAAIRTVLDDEGLAISKRKITLSTSGVVPLIERCGEELGVGLAVLTGVGSIGSRLAQPLIMTPRNSVAKTSCVLRILNLPDLKSDTPRSHRKPSRRCYRSRCSRRVPAERPWCPARR